MMPWGVMFWRIFYFLAGVQYSEEIDLPGVSYPGEIDSPGYHTPGR